MDTFIGETFQGMGSFAKRASELGDEGYALHSWKMTHSDGIAAIFVLMPEYARKPKPMGAR